jgi:hypothetical protein
MKELELPKELNNTKQTNIDNSIKIKDYLKLLNQKIPNRQFNNIYIIYLFILLLIIYLHL